MMSSPLAEVISTTRVLDAAARISSVAAAPSPSGKSKSISTTSGVVAVTIAMASRAVPAMPVTTNAGSAVSAAASPSATIS